MEIKFWEWSDLLVHVLCPSTRAASTSRAVIGPGARVWLSQVCSIGMGECVCVMHGWMCRCAGSQAGSTSTQARDGMTSQEGVSTLTALQ